MRESLKVLLGGLALLLGSLAYGYQYVWNAVNTNGEIAYQVWAAGLPLQYVEAELSSPVGASSYVRVDPVWLVLDLVFWMIVVDLGLRLSRTKAKANSAPSSQG
jgi:hypothetical protein